MAACCAWACSGDSASEPDLPGGEDKYMLLLRISPLDTGEAADAEVTERIKSLRVIVLTAPEEGTDAVPEIEYNRLVTPAEFGTTAATGFQYEIMLLTTEGKKDVYLIANEGSIGTIAYQTAEGSTLNVGALPTTFGDFLDRYKTGGDGPAPDAAEFKEAVEAIYFEPEYEYESEPGSDERTLYLPYMSHYEVEATKRSNNRLTMYLVPVATKFTFKFINKLNREVSLNEISVKSTDTQNFLLAHVGEEDYEKDFDETTMYWVDWLAKVAEKTHDAPNNAAINQQYGWISDYGIPTAGKTGPDVKTEFIGSSVPLPALKHVVEEDETETDVPSVVVLGPYYRPESRREVTHENTLGGTVTEHEYLLTLGLTDASGSGPEFADVAIGNLHALFRNTSVYITITISSDDVEVYAEISGWNRHSANGWVTNGDDSKYVDPDS